MATTTPTIVQEITHVRTGPWAVNYLSSDFSTLNIELKAAPTRTNSATYITHVTMGIVADDSDIIVDANLTLIDGAGSAVFGPIQLQSNGQAVFSKDFKYPMKITDNKALDISGSAVNGAYQSAAFVFIEGFTGDNPII